MDFLDFRFFNPFQKLAGVCRQGLDISPLALRINRVKRKGGLSGAAYPSDNR